MSNLILFNKPFNVLSQFTGETGQTTLAHFLNSPDSRGYYPAGRLDYDSEGLLLLTNNGALQHRISSPRYKLPKTYWVQVEGIISDDALAQLEAGIGLKDGKTRPAEARAMEEPKLWPRTPPIRERKSIPTSWLELTISEGRNRQVRRMTAAVGLPTLRLIRVAIGNWSLKDLAPGEFRFEATQAPPPKPRTNTSHSKRPTFRPGVRNRP